MTNRQHDIEKYLRDELSPAERHALEKAALNDPFLSEALEGAGQLPAAEFQDDVDTIKNLLHQRINKKSKVISLWGWTARIAAGLVLVGASITLLWNVLNQQPAEELALNKTKTETTEQAQPAPSLQPITDSISSTQESIESSAMDDNSQSKTTDIKPNFDNQLTLAEEEETLAKMDIVQTIPIPAEEKQQPLEEVLTDRKEAVEEEAMMENVAPVSTPPLASVTTERREEAKVSRSGEVTKKRLAADKADANVAMTVKGKVTSEEGLALPGANVIVKGTTIGAVTDVNGNFEVPVSDSTQSLVFSFIGMVSQEVAINDKPQINVQLDPDVSSLSEVVVVGYGIASDDNDEPKIILAMPEGGRLAYNQYLEKNLRYPELALENNVEGRVTVQFTVNEFGKLSDFKVIKGLGFGCDEEVIRLIQQGPKWYPTTKDSEPISDNVRVKMRFKKPRK